MKMGTHLNGLCDWLPRTVRKNDTIWVIVDWLTKSTHFLAIRVNLPLRQLAEQYVSEIGRLHGIPVSIVSDRDAVYLKVLEDSAGGFWHSTQLQYSIPPSIGWPDRADHSDARGHAESLCH